MLWCETYRPKKVSECILPSELKTTFQKFVEDRFVPNLLLNGTSGVGKTTVALAMLDELGCDHIILNGSLNVSIDTLRTDVRNYASSISMMGGRKYVILDEADYLHPQHVQPALRHFMEEFSKNCGFIFTCNYKNKILDPIHSRCSVIDFKINGKQKSQLANEFLVRACYILKNENVEYDKKVVAEVITKYFPDWRRTINELQKYSASGKIDVGILSQVVDFDIKELIKHLREKDFVEVRKWIAVNSASETNILFRKIYDTAHDYMKPESIPPLVLILADYQYKAAFVADHQINLAAAMTQIMIDCEFK